MPTLRLTKSTIDALPIGPKDVTYWDETLKGYGVKVTPKGRKVFLVLYRTVGGALRKFTIGPYGRVTPHLARIEARKILAARLRGATRQPRSGRADASTRWTGSTTWSTCSSPSTSRHVARERNSRAC